MVVTINPTAVSILPLLVFLVPLAFGVLIFALGRFGRFFRDGLALMGIAATLGISVMMAGRILGGEVLTWWSNNLYVDGLAAVMELSASIMGVIVVVYSMWYFGEKTKEEEAHPFTSMTSYYGQILLFLGLMNWTCATNNIIMLYVSLEFTTLATVFLVTFHWNKQAMEAGYKYLLLVTVGVIFALLGSVLLYAAATPYLPVSRVLLLTELGTVATKIPTNIVLLAAAFLVVGFGTKAGLVPFHAWLPDAHVEAPTAGSVLLAGVLLKLGGYGFLRFSLPMLPEASAFFAPMVFALSIVAIVYTSLVALVQTDMKKLIAYSSVAHMGIVTIGCFTANALGLTGALVQMLSHGLVSAALFMVVGVVYDRIHSREIEAYGGLAERMPVYATLFMLFMLASVGLPGTSGFVGEILVIVGIFGITPESPAIPAAGSWVALLAATGMVLGAAYMLWLYRRVIFGALEKGALAGIRDLRPNELAAFAPLVLLVLLMGVYPSLFTDPMAASVDRVLAEIGAAGPGRLAAQLD